MERDDVISLQDYLVVLKRQRWLILSTTLLVVVAAIGVSFAQTPQYEGEAEVVVERVRRTQDVSLEDLLAPSGAAVETERVVMQSRAVVERAAEALGTSDLSALSEQVRVESVRDTRVVRVIATDPDPARAADIANAFTDAYLGLRRDQAVDELLSARATLEDRAADLRQRIEQLDATGSGDTSDTVEREALVAQLAQVSAQIAELGDAAEAVTGGGQVLTPADVPTSPVSPRPLRTGALAVVLGLLLGIGFAFLRDHLDDVVRDEPDFKRATGGRPILGRIPIWEDPAGNDRLVTIVAPSSVPGESFRELSAGVRFMLLASGDEHAAAQGGEVGPVSPSRHGRSLMVTSAVAGEGQTSVAANLAVAAARVGLRTVLVDADLRRATVGRRFGLGRTTGLSDALLSGGHADDHLVDVGIDNLRVLTAGTIPPNPNELLASAAMGALHRQLAAAADLVIYDTPAALAVPDALELGRFVDLTILVGRQEASGRRQLGAAIERFEQTGIPIGGTVLNHIDSRSAGYYYAYQYEYVAGSDAEPSAAPNGDRPRRADRRGARRDRAAGSSEPEDQTATDEAVDAGGHARLWVDEDGRQRKHADGGTTAWDSFFDRPDADSDADAEPDEARGKGTSGSRSAGN